MDTHATLEPTKVTLEGHIAQLPQISTETGRSGPYLYTEFELNGHLVTAKASVAAYVQRLIADGRLVSGRRLRVVGQNPKRVWTVREGRDAPSELRSRSTPQVVEARLIMVL